MIMGGARLRASRGHAAHLDVPVGDAQAVAVVHGDDQLLEQPPRVRLRDAHLHTQQTQSVFELKTGPCAQNVQLMLCGCGEQINYNKMHTGKQSCQGI